MKCLVCGKELQNRFSLERHVTTSYGKEKDKQHLPILVYRAQFEGEHQFGREELMKMYEDGMSTPRMARTLKVNKKTLLDTMRYYGLTFRDRVAQGKNRANVLGVWNDGKTKFDHQSIMRYAKSRVGKNNPYFTAPNFDERHQKSLAKGKWLSSLSPTRNPKSTEMRMMKILSAKGLSFKRNFCLTENRKWRLFDFLVEGRLLIELQGDYWHGNPQFYKASDLIGKGGRTTAETMWRYDAEKHAIAQRADYPLFVIWESEMAEKSDTEIASLVTEALS